jgi:hypothetical protein
MNRVIKATIGCAMLLASRPVGAITVTVEQDAPWLGYMNVFESAANGGGYLWGQPWGTADLVAGFSGDVLTLAPNTIGDPAEYWYVGGGAPGHAGNKTMDANFYIEDDTLNGQSVTFEGEVLANTLSGPHTAIAFIKDFAADYSSFEQTTVPLAPGPFSITLATFGFEGRHIQYGFTLNGPNVWVTDVAPFGNVQISAPGGAAIPGDFNGDQSVDGDDLADWKTAFGSTAVGDADGDEDSDGADFLIWQQNLTGAPAIAAVPEPATGAMATAALALALAARLKKRMS